MRKPSRVCILQVNDKFSVRCHRPRPARAGRPGRHRRARRLGVRVRALRPLWGVPADGSPRPGDPARRGPGHGAARGGLVPHWHGIPPAARPGHLPARRFRAGRVGRHGMPRGCRLLVPPGSSAGRRGRADPGGSLGPARPLGAPGRRRSPGRRPRMGAPGVCRSAQPPRRCRPGVMGQPHPGRACHRHGPPDHHRRIGQRCRCRVAWHGNGRAPAPGAPGRDGGGRHTPRPVRPPLSGAPVRLGSGVQLRAFGEHPRTARLRAVPTPADPTQPQEIPT